MASAWGDSWGSAWGDSWGVISTPDAVVSGGGRRARRPSQKEQERYPLTWVEREPLTAFAADASRVRFSSAFIERIALDAFAQDRSRAVFAGGRGLSAREIAMLINLDVL